MTLFKQIMITFSTILLFILGLVLTISFLDTKQYIENELYMKAQNGATVLALNMSNAKGDVTVMSTMANALFDNGYFHLIILKDGDNKILFKKTSDEINLTPKWFSDLVYFTEDSANAQVSNGWTPVGILSVKASKASSLKYLYDSFKNIVFIFIGMAVVGILLIYLLLKTVLKPLDKVKQQAEMVKKNKFVYQEEIPKTKELKQVVMAINTIVKKTEKIYKNLQGVTNKNKRLEYLDEFTMIGNRKYFILKFNEYVNADDSRAVGTLFSLRIQGTQEANKAIGFNEVNTIYSNIARIINENIHGNEDAYVSRISGVEFAYVLPVVDVQTAKDISDKILKEVRAYIDCISKIKNIIFFSMAGICYKHKDELSKILSSVDFTLNSFENSKKDNFEFIEDATKRTSLNRVELRDTIAEAIKARFLIPKEKYIVGVKTNQKIKFLSFIILDEKIGKLDYKAYFPVLTYHDLFRSYLDYVWSYLEEASQGDNIAIEIPIMYFDDIVAIDNIKKNIKKFKDSGVNIFIEFSQSNILMMDPEKERSILNNLHNNNINVAINSFDADEKIIRLLHMIHPKYVRIYADHFLDMSENLKDNLIMMLKTIDIRIGIDNTNEESQTDILKFDVDYLS
ncbi:MAG: LapD/MoxY N-terminal periplasmic domain-containing protein [Sulfurospirillaceae bacterium]|nr:LapD/MoxY N-terminal periplasmic domain-containing protein [Sulfurospirillaceae bacterium]